MTQVAKPRLLLPDSPILVPGPRTPQGKPQAVLLTTEGSFETIGAAQVMAEAQLRPPVVCHRLATFARLGVEAFPALDVLELYAFVRPARFCVPTPRGLAEALDLLAPQDAEDCAQTLLAATRRLLEELGNGALAAKAAIAADLRGTAWTMARAGWGWGPSVLAALGVAGDGRSGGLRVWERLPEWSEHAPEPPAGSIPVEVEETRQRLTQMLGPNAEQRPQQAAYASAATAAFQPREVAGEPHVVLAEAGTGTGKTLGYIAPASLWAEKNQGPVWIATYTRNLQRQLDAELDRLFPIPAEKARKVVVRKGRENYLCLLNMEEAISRMGNLPGAPIVLGLMARWALATRDGDMVGGDFPGWLADLLGRPRTLGLADRRGECIYSACQHYSRCFIERAIRKARRAEIVVANHALVLVQAGLGGLDDGTLPTRYVFDEGHNLFDAADGAFSAHLTGGEAAELRRWLLGAEGDGSRSRARGLRRRAEDLVGDSDEAIAALEQALQAARALPGPGWHQRITEGQPHGPVEIFLGLLRQQVYARAGADGSPYDLECTAEPPLPGLPEAAAEAAAALDKLTRPLRTLAKLLLGMLDDEAAELETATRQRIEGICRSIDRRALIPLAAWADMLKSASEGGGEQLVQWFGVTRSDGRDTDVGFHRHWVDPMKPFAKFVAEPAHGLLITSATLRDGSGDAEADWQAAERRCGTPHLAAPAIRAAVPSPFDYEKQTRVFVVSDVRKDDMAQVASAYRELFLAAGGGALGLFTAISRLRAVHQRIAPALEAAGLDLLAQHVTGMDTSTLVDIFRAEEDACLLGTDAVRDGVDVPGRSLRLLVFDRVPWPRPDILHKARRAAFGGKTYDDMITRLKLKQAYGRLVRRATDTGVFVLLDPLMPSRLHGAFPVPVQKVGLAEAVAETKRFLITP